MRSAALQIPRGRVRGTRQKQKRESQHEGDRGSGHWILPFRRGGVPPPPVDAMNVAMPVIGLLVTLPVNVTAMEPCVLWIWYSEPRSMTCSTRVKNVPAEKISPLKPASKTQPNMYWPSVVVVTLVEVTASTFELATGCVLNVC